jgi:hypothetical protein
MEYLLFIVSDPEAEPYNKDEDRIEEWVEEVYGKGIGQRGNRLRPANEASTVRIRNGELIVTDGPFTESKEWIAGFDILECDTKEQAIEAAAKHPMARFGRVEVREAWPFD